MKTKNTINTPDPWRLYKHKIQTFELEAQKIVGKLFKVRAKLITINKTHSFGFCKINDRRIGETNVTFSFVAHSVCFKINEK